jgi:hypothetical protein
MKMPTMITATTAITKRSWKETFSSFMGICTVFFGKVFKKGGNSQLTPGIWRPLH